MLIACGTILLLATGMAGTPAIPDLELCYRQRLSVDETFRCGVVNRSADANGTNAYFVSLRWKTDLGRTVADFGPAELKASTGSALAFEKPAAGFAPGRLLLPELVVTGAGQTQVFRSGLGLAVLTEAPGADFEWARLRLRDLALDVVSTVAVGSETSDGTRRVSGRVTGPVAFRSFEALTDNTVVYRAGAPAAGPEECGVRLTLAGGVRSRPLLNGFIGISNVDGLVCRPIGLQHAQAKQGGWVFRGAELTDCESFAVFAAAVPAAAEVVVAVKGVFGGRIPVRDLLAKGRVSLPGFDGAMLGLERWYGPMAAAPQSLGSKTIDVDFRWRPTGERPVLCLRAVDERGRIWQAALHP